MIPFLCGGIISAIGFVIGHIRQQSKTQKEISQGLQALLRSDIIRIHDKYVDLGYCPLNIKEALHREYISYHNLGGNDIATLLYEETMELPEHKEVHYEGKN